MENVIGDEIGLHAFLEVRPVLIEQVRVARLLNEVRVDRAGTDGGRGDFAAEVLPDGLAQREDGVLGGAVDAAELEDVTGCD